VFVTSREQGDRGEISAVGWFANKGATVAWPLNHSPHWDLIVEWDGSVYRVQVKTSTFYLRRRWSVAICTRGGNQSWNGVTKRFDPSLCDLLFAHVGDGRRWMIPATAVEASRTICLGGPKYSEWEVERGEPLPKLTRPDLAA
jgi:hypothetical protein